MASRRLAPGRKCARPACAHYLPPDAAAQMRYHDNACRVRHQRERMGVTPRDIDEIERIEALNLPKRSDFEEKE